MIGFSIFHRNRIFIAMARSFFILVCLIPAAAGQAHSTADERTIPVAGDKAPDFALNALDGTSIKLSSELKRGPVVLIVLRGWPGYQCPYCTRQVGEFITRAKDIEATGARLILVYPGPSEMLKEHAEEFRGNKDIPKAIKLVIDPDYNFTNAYHLRWDAKGETAYPSTFIIDKNSTVRFALVSKAHGGRSKADDVIAVLTKLKEGK